MSTSLRFPIAFLALALLLTALAMGSSDPGASTTLLTRQRFDIGTHEASLFLSDKWKRREVNADMGKDQFVLDPFLGATQVLIVMELEGLFDTEEDLLRRLELVLNGIDIVQGSLTGPENDSSGRDPFATAGFSCKEGGLDVRYRISVVGRGSLAYMLMSWRMGKGAKDLDAASLKAARDLRLPPDDSEWARGLEPTTKRQRLGSWSMEYSIQETLFQPAEKGDAFACFQTSDQALFVYLFGIQGHMRGDQALDESGDVLRGNWPRMDEVRRSDRTLAGIRSREAILHDPTTPLVSAQVIHIPLETYGLLEVRMVYDGDEDALRAYRERILDSIRLERGSTVLTFPEVESEPSSAQLTPQGFALLDASDRYEALEYPLTSFHGTLSDGWIACDAQSTRGLGRRGGFATFSKGDWSFHRSAARTRNGLFEVQGQYELHHVEDGVSEPLGVDASWIAPFEGGLLLARRDTPPAFLGLDPRSEARSSLILRSGEREEVIVKIDGHGFERFAVDERRGRALCSLQAHGTYSEERTLEEIDLKTGDRTPLGRWSAVHHLVPIEEGWLVSGRPFGTETVTGVHLVRNDAPTEIWILGSGLNAVGASPTGLWLEVHLPSGDTELHHVPRSAVRENGPGWRPLRVPVLRAAAEAGEQALAALNAAPGTRAAIETYLAAAEQTTRARRGSGLPRDPDGVDRLIMEWYGDDRVDGRMVELASALLCRTLLDHGAIWIEAEAGPSPDRTTRSSVVLENDIAMGVTPFGIARSTLLDDEGWWEPAKTLVDRVGGRTLLIGDDGGALQEALDLRANTNWFVFAQAGMGPELTNWLLARPANLHARERAYNLLASRGHRALVRTLAAEFCNTEHEAEIDRRAYLASRVDEGVRTVEEHETLRAELWSAIQRYPDSTWLPHLLGSHYEHHPDGPEVELAMACYQRAVTLSPWSPAGQAAEEALERLGSD